MSEVEPQEQAQPEASDTEQSGLSASLPEWADYCFEVERALTVPDKGVMVIGTYAGRAPRVKGDVRFTPHGEGHEVTCPVLGVVNKLFDDDGAVLEGRLGLVLQYTERKDLRRPMQVYGVTGTAPEGAQSAETGEAEPTE